MDLDVLVCSLWWRFSDNTRLRSQLQEQEYRMFLAEMNGLQTSLTTLGLWKEIRPAAIGFQLMNKTKYCTWSSRYFSRLRPPGCLLGGPSRGTFITHTSFTSAVHDFISTMTTYLYLKNRSAVSAISSGSLNLDQVVSIIDTIRWHRIRKITRSNSDDRELYNITSNPGKDHKRCCMYST
jgi:hypothetical protein